MIKIEIILIKYEKDCFHSKVKFPNRNSGGTHCSKGLAIRGIRVRCDCAWTVSIKRILWKAIPRIKALVYRSSGIISASFCVEWISHAVDLSSWLELALFKFLVTRLTADVLDSFPLSMVTPADTNKAIKFSASDSSFRSQVKSTAAVNIYLPFPLIPFLLSQKENTNLFQDHTWTIADLGNMV